MNGAFRNGREVTFSLWAPRAKEIALGLFAPGEESPFATHEMKKDDVWSLTLDLGEEGLLYGYSIDKGEWLVDPYARQLNQTNEWDAVQPLTLGQIDPNVDFDWEGDAPLNTPPSDLIIYEMHVRGFTQDVTSAVAHPGTYLGLIEKIFHLKELGITAVELLPIFTFNERDNPHTNPITNRPLHNYWGYSPTHFFTPMSRYASTKGEEIIEFKKMVKALHDAGIAVILDVVFNHTSNDCSLKKIDREGYFLLDDEGNDTNYTGCGNTLACNRAHSITFIVDCLRYWVEEMHVDGFRFDLATIFCRGEKGEVLENPPVVEAIISDPILANTLLIAEPWDCAGLLQIDSFPGGGRFLEWNGSFRDSVRCFVNGEDVPIADREGSIKFVTAHDGFTLHDLVSYNEKHNEENGEENRDGSDHNLSCNWGVEGPTADPEIRALRHEKMKQFLEILIRSKGVPMICMGDEYGHTRYGNNNAYSQDNYKNYFLWDELEKDRELFNHLSNLLQRNRPM